MIFSELYSAYYNTVAEILKAILSGETDEKELKKKVSDHAFGDSFLTIIPSLKEEKWQLVYRDLTSPIKHTPTMPMTTLEKMWLKAVSLDPKVKLFGLEFPNPEDVKPLFTPQDYKIYDQYNNGDPFESEGYIRRFRLILDAIKTKRPILIVYTTKLGRQNRIRLLPKRLEYSEKDNKFRLITTDTKYGQFNLGKIEACEYYSGNRKCNVSPILYDTRHITFTVIDERNALQRVMLHFAHFEKQAERTANNTYRVTLKYYRNDETEMVIRILSFGPFIKVTEPEYFINLIKERLKQQKICGLK